MLRQYQTGGGTQGNAAANTVTQLLGGVPFVNGVTNPIAAEGGADAEDLADVRVRGPGVFRHRERALAARDYEALAREASPAVAVARAVPATGPDGRTAPGWVKLVVMPHSQDPQPQPSVGLRQEVHDYVAALAPADLAGLEVDGPDYWPVGVNVTVTPVQVDQAGPVGVAARQAIQAFLHPLTGGPDGQGWPPGRSVYLSDVAVAVGATPGLDHASELELTLDGIPQGEQVDVPPDRIIVAGPVLVKVQAAGQTC
jgi:predicted phage baseplate assembly protein